MDLEEAQGLRQGDRVTMVFGNECTTGRVDYADAERLSIKWEDGSFSCFSRQAMSSVKVEPTMKENNAMITVDEVKSAASGEDKEESKDALFVPLAEFKPADLFDGKRLMPMLEKIQRDVLSEVLDASTEDGRKRIGSLNRKVAGLKSKIDQIGKALVEPLKKQAAVVDAERKKAREFCEGLQVKITAPRDEFELKESERKMRVSVLLQEVHAISQVSEGMKAADIADRINLLEARAIGAEYEGNREEAVKSRQEGLFRLRSIHAVLVQRERDAAELEALRLEKAERDAKAKAEADARDEAARIEKAVKDQAAATIAKLEADKLAAEKAAEQAAEQAVADAKAKIEKAEADFRAKIAAEADARDKADAARKLDVEHRGRINREALAGLVAEGVPEDCAKLCVASIAKGKVPNVKISY